MISKSDPTNQSLRSPNPMMRRFFLSHPPHSPPLQNGKLHIQLGLCNPRRSFHPNYNEIVVCFLNPTSKKFQKILPTPPLSKMGSSTSSWAYVILDEKKIKSFHPNYNQTQHLRNFRRSSPLSKMGSSTSS